MLKKFFVMMITFVTVFLSQSQVWATVNHSEKISTDMNISIDKSTFMAADDTPAVIARRERTSGSNENSGSIAWIASFFIMGLGQIIMGDVWRGLKFYLFAILIGVGAGLINVYLSSLAILIVYIWNVVDAYNMSREQAEEAGIDNQKRLALFQEKLEKLSQNIKTSNSNYFSIYALTF